MKFIKSFAKKFIKQSCQTEMMKRLPEIPMEKLNVDTMMAELKVEIAKDENVQAQLGMLGLTDDDLRDVCKDILPKLRKAKEKMG